MIALPKHLQRLMAGEFERYWLLHCPFHRDLKPSMLLYKDDGFYVCKSCQRMGNERNLLDIGGGSHAGAEVKRIGRSHLQLPTDQDGIARFVDAAHRVLEHWPGQGEYLSRRGLADRIGPRRLGWWSGWITVPVFNRFGVTQGVYLRATPGIQRKSGQRFTQPKGQAPMLYVPNYELTLSAPFTFIVFGWADALTLDKLGYPVATTTGGKDEFDPVWVSEWRKPLVLVPDAGEEASMGPLLRAFGWRGVVLRLNYSGKTKDPNGFLEAGESALLERQLGKVKAKYAR